MSAIDPALMALATVLPPGNAGAPARNKKTGAVIGARFAFLPPAYAVATGILPIRACHSFGPVVWTEVPWASTATVTGMSFTSNS